MSSADPQAALARLKQTLADLQGLVNDIEAQRSSEALPIAALDHFSSNTKRLIRQLQEEATLPSPVAQPSHNKQPQAPGNTSTATASRLKTITNQVLTPPRPAGTQSMSWRQKPWWQQQKIWFGAASLAVAGLCLWQLLLGQPQTSGEIANTPQVEAQVVADNETPVEDLPSQEDSFSDPVPITPVASIPTITAAEDIPLTPEQRLIAAVQTQLDEVTQPYGDNIVRRIRADFKRNTLEITVGDGWYLLRPGLQNRLGTEVLKLAQILDFKKMIVQDLAGNFVAREPVVGDRLVITKRYEEFAAER